MKTERQFIEAVSPLGPYLDKIQAMERVLGDCGATMRALARHLAHEKTGDDFKAREFISELHDRGQEIREVKRIKVD